MERTEQQILRKALAQFIVSDVFNLPLETELLKMNGTTWEFNGHVLSDQQKTGLKAEATEFMQSALWRIIKAELLQQAHEKGYVKAQTEEDMIAGKMLHYLVDIVESKLKRIVQ